MINSVFSSDQVQAVVSGDATKAVMTKLGYIVHTHVNNSSSSCSSSSNSSSNTDNVNTNSIESYLQLLPLSKHSSSSSSSSSSLSAAALSQLLQSTPPPPPSASLQLHAAKNDHKSTNTPVLINAELMIRKVDDMFGRGITDTRKAVTNNDLSPLELKEL